MAPDKSKCACKISVILNICFDCLVETDLLSTCLVEKLVKLSETIPSYLELKSGREY